MTQSFTGLALLCLATAPLTGADTNGAKAELKNAKGTVIGQATLTGTPNGVLIRLDLDKGPPGARALHIHESGSCETPDFASAGDHFNPRNAPHGFQNAGGPHAGDLPNLHVPQDGKLVVETLARGATLDALLDENGSALVIHAGADDYATDPAGDAGDRVACGVIAR